MKPNSASASTMLITEPMNRLLFTNTETSPATSMTQAEDDSGVRIALGSEPNRISPAFCSTSTESFVTGRLGSSMRAAISL